MTEAAGFRSSVMVRATHLTNAASIGLVLVEARKLYTDFGNPPPPFPDNALTLTPCCILVTERMHPVSGERIGRVQFLQPDGSARSDGSSLFDQEWMITAGR